MPNRKRVKTPQQIWECISSTLVHAVEKTFFSLGVSVARHPWWTVILTWCFVLLSGVGLIKFHIEKNPMKLWVPPDSNFYHDTNWYVDTFGTIFRVQKLIVTANNVLEPEVINKIKYISDKVDAIQIEYNNTNYKLDSLCYKVPVVNFYSQKSGESSSKNRTVRQKNNENDFSDPTLWVDDSFYCDFLEHFKLVCLQYNILDLWKNDVNLIESLTKNDIVKQINSVKNNPTTGHPVDYTSFLGGVEYDETGDIVVAKSLILSWYTQVNMSNVDLNVVGNLVGTEDWVTVELALWEKQFLNLMTYLSKNITDMGLFYEAGSSFADVSGQAMFQDMDKLFIGIGLMFLYIQFGLSRCNWLEIRFTLGSVGLLCVGMAYITAISWASVFDIPFGPVHSSLPFLLMGLGIDDMFVMSACWDNLSEDELKKSLPVKIGLMLKHAGVSIVITSFTDIAALLIGAITILPSLKSFCIYAALGVFFIFCFSVTFYVAIFTLDIRRIDANRNGLFICFKHKKQITLGSNKTAFQSFMSALYRNVIFSVPGKVIGILLTLVVTGFSIEAMLRLEQRFDPKWFIPDGTYYKEFLDTHDRYYPDQGQNAMVLLGNMDYNNEFKTLHQLVVDLKEKKYVDDVTSWVENFHGYVLKNYNLNLLNDTKTTNENFNNYLSRFVFSPIGGRFQMNFKFSPELRCGKPVDKIVASSISFRFSKFKGPEEYLPAMNDVMALVKSSNISSGDGYRSVWSKAFSNWVTDEIIAVEVERNVELALLCVMICTVILITNLQMCLWIFICVLLTIINVLGFMQRWGLTVDIVCCIGLELAIGLCVDYAAHVGHTFLTISDGTRRERALKTVTSIGTAVLLGGGSAFISLSLLSMSKAYTFQSFFKIFALVITFGLFNGLVFLPIVLSLVGPAAYKPVHIKDISAEGVELNGKKYNMETQIDDG